MNEPFITVARVARTQGRKGEVAADIFTDFPERFEHRKRLFALDQKGDRRALQVEEYWPHQNRIVLKFAGVDSISEAEALLGCELQIPEDQRADLEAGSCYVSDLQGCSVIDAGEGGGKARGNAAAGKHIGGKDGNQVDRNQLERNQVDQNQVDQNQVQRNKDEYSAQVLGEVTDVQFGAGDAPLLVVQARGGEEHLIPFAAEFVKSIDLKNKRIEMVLPEGLLEVNSTKSIAPEETKSVEVKN